MSRPRAREIVGIYSAWPVVVLGPAIILAASASIPDVHAAAAVDCYAAQGLVVRSIGVSPEGGDVVMKVVGV